MKEFRFTKEELCPENNADDAYWLKLASPPDSASLLTQTSGKKAHSVQWRENRPALIVSGTSWTADEDFGVLLHALCDYDQRARHRNEEKEKHGADTDRKHHLPHLVVVITGKGPMKAFYEAEMRKQSWKYVRVVTRWLVAEDYPKLLGSADLGVSLHQSSSGLDLPMKVVDMFGCNLPVISYNYETYFSNILVCHLLLCRIQELVVPNKTGVLFANSKELADRICVSFLLHHYKNTFSTCWMDFPTIKNVLSI